MQKRIILLALFSLVSFESQSKRSIPGLDNQSKKVYTENQLRKYVGGCSLIPAAVLGGLTYYSEHYGAKSETGWPFVALTGLIPGAIAGLVLYFNAQTPAIVHASCLEKIEKYHGLLFPEYEMSIIPGIQHYYVYYQFPLVEALDNLKELVQDLDLFVDMMENPRIVKSLSEKQYYEYSSLVPVYEDYILDMMHDMAVIKAHPDYQIEAAACREQMAVHAMQQTASAQMHAAHAAQQNAHANTIHAINSYNK